MKILLKNQSQCKLGIRFTRDSFDRFDLLSNVMELNNMSLVN